MWFSCFSPNSDRYCHGTDYVPDSSARLAREAVRTSSPNVLTDEALQDVREDAVHSLPGRLLPLGQTVIGIVAQRGVIRVQPLSDYREEPHVIAVTLAAGVG